MAEIPAGVVELGQAGSRNVEVAGFCMDLTEVTVTAYASCVGAGVCPPQSAACDPPVGGGRRPVSCVDWNGASAYCGWVGKRLPTEEQWVRAACGGDGRIYPWGNAEPTDQLCWMGEPGRFRNGSRGLCDVGSFAAGKSPFGPLDLAGNVSEWTSSVDRGLHVIRGGGFNESPAMMCCLWRCRSADGGDAVDPARGMRCVASLRT